jgi:hypothetical protein
MEKTMRKIIAAILVIATLMPSVSYADWNGHHRHWNGPRHNYGGGGGDAGAALFGGLVGGLIIGGMLNSMNQPQYVQQPYYDPYYQPVCNRYFAGRDIYGRPVFQTVCQ